MPKIDMNELHRQYREMLERMGGELPVKMPELKKKIKERPYEKLNEFEKLMLFMATLTEKNPTAGKQMQKDIRYKDLIIGAQTLRRCERFEETVIDFLGSAPGFGRLIDANRYTIFAQFATPEERRLLEDVAKITGEEKKLETLLSDPKVQQSMQPKPEKAPEPESVPKAEVRPRTNRYAPLYEGAQAQECADALETVLHKLGVPKDTLSGIANKAVSKIKLSGSAEFQRMARAALYVYQQQRTGGSIAKNTVDELQAASIFYCDQKPKVRATQSGRDRYQAALKLLTLVSAPDDKKLLGCFDRINAARKVKPGDADFVSTESFYTEAALAEAKQRQQTLAYRRNAAVLTAEAFMTGKLTTMGERFIDTESRYTVGHVKEDMPRYRDVTRSECVNALGKIWMDAVVKQQKEKQKRGADELPTGKEIKNHAVASRALLAATLAETIYRPEETVRTTQLDLLMQSVIKRYDLDRKLDEINFDNPNEIIATKNAFREVARAYCKENKISMAEESAKAKEGRSVEEELGVKKKDFTLGA